MYAGLNMEMGRGNVVIRLKYQKQTEMITKINFNFHVHHYLPQGI